MANVNPNLDELHSFFETLYGACDDGWLILSYPSARRMNEQGKPKLDSQWHDLARVSLSDVARGAATIAQRTTVYHGCIIQHPSRQPETTRRSWTSSAYVAPGLWFDLDLAYGQHAQSALPATDDEALEFLHSLPAEPSLIIHSGGGLYAWWLFKEPMVITTDEERQEFAALSKQFTATLLAAGVHRGWTLDALGDLTRVLRPPGSINTKYGRLLVTTIHESGTRYNPSDFNWLLPAPQAARSSQDTTPLAGQPDIATVAEHYGTVLGKKSATELCGAHPMHGSSTGTNFDVNTEKQLWHCHRHTTGGDAVSLIAVCAGLLACEQAKPGGLRGGLFWAAVKIARETFGATVPLPAPVSRAPWGNPFTTPWVSPWASRCGRRVFTAGRTTP